jgi:aminopeptidase N
MQNLTIHRKDYQPYPFDVVSIELSIDLYEHHTRVKSRLHLKRKHAGELRLNGNKLDLISIHLNDELLPHSEYQLIDGDLKLNNPADEFTLTTVVNIHPETNTTLSGLYRSNQIFCTQCEAEGFRSITFFPDRPDVLTTYTTRISADNTAYPILLSNGNCIESGQTDDGRHFVVWQDPFKKPAYLFALVAGDLACVRDTFVTMSGREIDLRVYVEHGNEPECQHALSSLKNAMRWDEERFGREYDLDTYMIVAVSAFNMGAMENKGLNIFNAKYILVSPQTAMDENYLEVEGVVGHEYFHNWTGNRITCRDWFQLSLKEGLTVFRDQEFSADMNARDTVRIEEVRYLRNHQFPEDAGPMAHPVRPESYEEINNFYTNTVYNKGAEVIRMQQTILGVDGFKRGMNLYFERHDGQAVTIDDFVAAMEDANHVDLTEFKRWYSQAGTPLVSVQSEFQNGRLTLTLKQTCPVTPEGQTKRPFHIPIRTALFSPDGQLIQEMLLELKESEATYTFEGLASSPTLSLLRDFSAPIKIQQIESEETLLALLKYETDGYAKWNAGQMLALNTLISWLLTAPQNWHLPEKLVDAYQHVMCDESLDRGLRAELVTPPHFEEVAATQPFVDATLIEQARDAFRHLLGKALYADAKRLYERLLDEEDGQMNHASFARRKLRNRCLWLMMKGDEQATLPLCRDLFEHASTMSSTLISCTLLVDSSNSAIGDDAIQIFYDKWSSHDLVMDKWFSLQATSERPNTLERVKSLLSHPDFQLTTPNKVRSLIGAFTQFNPRYFHAKDSSGYTFLTEMLLKIDAINPQVAARLATPFTRWQRLESLRKDLMHQQLKILAEHPLSRDLLEVVSKSLSGCDTQN